MLLVRHYYRARDAPPPFKCAVLFSPVSVYDPVAYTERGEKKVLSGKVNGGYPISIPVAIIYGSRDERKAECEGLVETTNPKLREVFVHGGDHEIPGSALRRELLESVKLARRIVYKAENPSLFL